MTSKNKLGLIVAGIIATGLITAGTVSAYNGGFGFERMLSNKAEVLGMDAEQLRNELEEKTFLEIAEEQGISQESLHETMQWRARERWEEMGLSDEKIAERLRLREERQVNCDGSGPLMNGEGSRGFRKGFSQE